MIDQKIRTSSAAEVELIPIFGHFKGVDMSTCNMYTPRNEFLVNVIADWTGVLDVNPSVIVEFRLGGECDCLPARRKFIPIVEELHDDGLGCHCFLFKLIGKVHHEFRRDVGFVGWQEGKIRSPPDHCRVEVAPGNLLIDVFIPTFGTLIKTKLPVVETVDVEPMREGLDSWKHRSVLRHRAKERERTKVLGVTVRVLVDTGRLKRIAITPEELENWLSRSEAAGKVFLQSVDKERNDFCASTTSCIILNMCALVIQIVDTEILLFGPNEQASMKHFEVWCCGFDISLRVLVDNACLRGNRNIRKNGKKTPDFHCAFGEDAT